MLRFFRFQLKMMKPESVSLSVLKMKIILLEIFCVTLFYKSRRLIHYLFLLTIFFSSDVEFCGYSVPHPSEAKIMLRIQCRQNPAIDALRLGLDELKRVCDVMMEKFNCALNDGEHEINMEKEI